MSTVQKMPAADTPAEPGNTANVSKTGSAVRDSFVSATLSVNTAAILQEENTVEEIHKNDEDDDGQNKPYVVNKAARKTKCRGPKKSCAYDNQIEKGTVRFGSRAEIDGRDSVFWRHLECVTKRMLTGKGATPDTLEKFIDFEVVGSGGDGSARLRITHEEAQQTKDMFRALFGLEPAQKTDQDASKGGNNAVENKKRSAENADLETQAPSNKHQKL